MRIAKKKQGNSIKPHRSRLDERLSYMKSLALSMGKYVGETLNDAKSIFTHEKIPDDLFLAMDKRETNVNTLQIKISKACFRALARQAPVAKDLRMVITILNASTDLERMGDLAINIARRVQKIQSDPSLNDYYSHLENMFNSTISIFQLSMDAFLKESIELSKPVLKMDDIVDSHLNQIRNESKSIMKKQSQFISTCLEFIIIGGSLERIADHSTNIAEEVIFLQTGKDIRHNN